MEFTFRHNSNGTCSVMGIKDCTDTEITIPQVSPRGSIITSIGRGAFSYCHDIKSITIPTSVVRIGDFVFEGCANLI